MIKGPIAYPGAKWKVLEQIMELVPEGIEDWREPFFGGGSVTLGFLQNEKSKDCKRFVVGDLATEVYSFWKGTQQNANKVMEIAQTWWREKVPTHRVVSTTCGMNKDLKKYIRTMRAGSEIPEELRYCVDVWNKLEREGIEFWNWAESVDCNQLTLEERAARFFLVMRTSFSSMGDSGSLSKDQLIDFNEEHIKKIGDVSGLLQRVEIYNQTFQKTFEGCDEEKGFIFLDPPYCNQEKSGLYGRNGDTHHGFPHQEFADLCKGTKTRWLITYDDSIAVRRMFKGKGIWTRPLFIQYTMAGKRAEDALAGEELFIANYDISEKSSYDDLKDLL